MKLGSVPLSVRSEDRPEVTGQKGAGVRLSAMLLIPCWGQFSLLPG